MKPQIGDAGLENLKGLAALRDLNLGNTEVSDAGLKLLAGLSQLNGLWLDGTKVTDAGLQQLKGFTQLRSLNSTIQMSATPGSKTSRE